MTNPNIMTAQSDAAAPEPLEALVFNAAELDWQEISPRWAPYEQVSMMIGWLIFTAIVAVPLFVWAPWWSGVIAVVTGLALLGWRLTRAQRLRRAWGYAERGEDLFIRHGIWFREMTAVPYGRMQMVEVESGPIERKFGLATVKLVTAGGGGISVPGLEAEAAAHLRERLTLKGEGKAGGL